MPVQPILVICHVAHEGLGSMEPLFKKKGVLFEYQSLATDDSLSIDHQKYSALIVMGGPMGVYQTEQYPFLETEVKIIRAFLAEGKPFLGICLGAQVLAKALGAFVGKNKQKEIGWYPLNLTDQAKDDPLFKKMKVTETVFQWHGDTFQIPQGAVCLASSPLCTHQAFRFGKNVYGLQFHVEMTKELVDEWLSIEANKEELESLRGQIDPLKISTETLLNLPRLQEICQGMVEEWLGFLPP